MLKSKSELLYSQLTDKLMALYTRILEVSMRERKQSGLGQVDSSEYVAGCNHDYASELKEWESQSALKKLISSKPVDNREELLKRIRRVYIRSDNLDSSPDVRHASSLARDNYYAARPDPTNRGDQDNPSWQLPWDGQHFIVRRWSNSDSDWGVLVRYDEGRGDKAWMEERERNYIRRTQPNNRAAHNSTTPFSFFESLSKTTLQQMDPLVKILSLLVVILGVSVMYLLFSKSNAPSPSGNPSTFGR